MAQKATAEPSVELDLATRVLSPDQKIWSIFPGIGRKFFGTFLQENIIFLDLPRLNLNHRVLEDDDLLRQHIALSQAWVRYYYSAEGNPPSRNPQSYSVEKNASFNSVVGSVRAVFKEMKAGDLVLVGASTLYDPILVGEIAGPFNNEVFTHYERYGRDRIPARRVQWLRTDFERRYLSQELSKLLSNRRAVISIPKESFADEIYGLAYGDYVFGENSQYIYEGKKYNNIGIEISPGLKLLSYYIAAFHASDIGQIEAFTQLDVDAAIAEYFAQEDLYSFEVDFQSPGEYVLHAKRAILPLFVAVLVAATAGDLSLTDARAADVKNSAVSASTNPSAANACVEIEEKYRAVMNSINADRYNELCKLNKEAQAGVGLKVNVRKRIRNKK